MALPHVLRPLMQWPRLRHRYCSGEALYHFFITCSSLSSKINHVHHQLFLFNSSFRFSYHRNLHSRTRALKLGDVPLRSNSNESDSDSSSSEDGTAKKSRNEKKRDAKRADRWGMELANFSPPQIKLIVRATSLEPEVYDALMLVKRFGPDVREGKRRQFNYIGRLLRDVEPELMNALIQATKDGDSDKLRSLCDPETQAIEDGNETSEETEDEYEEEESETCNAVATRWFDGLVNKDIEVMNEIYSLNNVDFDRQELRRLVRELHIVQEHQVSLESEQKSEVGNAEVFRAKRSLSRFLKSLAKQNPVE